MHSKGKRFGKKLSSLLVILFVFFSSISFVPKGVNAQSLFTRGAQGLYKSLKFWVGIGHAGFATLDTILPESNVGKTSRVSLISIFSGLLSDATIGMDTDTLSNSIL